ncbi:MAG: ABC transporter ATP-binding protein/permease [Anaerostipes hadrus]|jgi:ATP-binding cassette subfamily C protein|nr:MAG: ABC transporter ATP-binding protein/permease [Anaerostipes hadrus]
MENTTKQRRSSIKIMGKMIGLVKPLAHIMIAAVLLGSLGYLCAISLTITAGHSVLLAMKGQPVTKYLIILVVLAVMRGILHYAEQYCNHFIAFKLLAIIRHQVFAVLRKLCPAKLDGREKGNLISIITTDIELLEVFYAHTISPIMIAILTSLIMVVFIGRFHVYAGIFAVCSYLLVGCVIPLRNGSKGGQKGMEFRSGFGKLNSFVLESLRGIDETIQYGQGKKRKTQISEKSIELGKMQKDLNRMEAMQRAVTDLVILCCSFGMFFLMYHLYQAGNVTFDAMLLATIAMMGSFGPVTALSSLSNNLNQTLASGERVLSLLEEEPMVEELEGEVALSFEGASVEDVTFAYNEEIILKDCNINMKQGKVIGICGKSGCGKSTLLKLLMRFWDVNKGNIKISEENVKEIPTKTLRNIQSYVTQETELFHDSIANNIAIGKPGAAREEIIKAAKKASIHDMIMSLPNGYDTEVGELGDTLSGGEKQRIGIARAFLHDSPMLLLDEPTSNLDSLNEGIILKSLKEESRGRTVVLVSHRESTMGIADEVYHMDAGRVS